MEMRALTRLDEAWNGPVPTAPLRVFRTLFALSALAYMISLLPHASEWLTTAGFHVSLETRFELKPAPAPLLPASFVPLFAIALLGSLAATALGVGVRVAVWVAFACLLYVAVVDVPSAYTINKIYIVGFLVLGLASTMHGDALRASAWPIRVLQATLILSYFISGACKIVEGDWLGGGDVLWTQVQGHYRTDFAATLLGVLPRGAWAIPMYGSLAFELLAPVLFIVPRLRAIGLVWGVVFHLSIALLMAKLIFFSLQFCCFYVLFLPDRITSRMDAGLRRLLFTPAPRTQGQGGTRWRTRHR